MLDTHILVWWVTGDFSKLSPDARVHLDIEPPVGPETQDRAIMVSSVTALEIAQLVSRDRLTLAMDLSAWLAAVESIPGVVFVPVDNDIAVKSVELPGMFHKDPADRIIVATARKYGVPLITADRKIHDYPHVQTIW